MYDAQTFVVFAKTVTLVFGGIITFYTFRAFRRTGSPALRSLTVGLGLLTLGALLSGGTHTLVGGSTAIGIGINSTLMAAGFASMTYSLYVRESNAAAATGTREGQESGGG
ncbi:MAG: hypothetical protein ACI9YT_000601 [Halobacteriales archaeon]|jgi:hypothetical protein